MRIKVDRNLCSGYALCVEAAPNVFDMDEHDIAVVIAEPGDLAAERENADYAARLCPRQAIVIESGD
ncbi:MAG: ferredoxin [Gammaproteobacteria bacterium]|nr:ferredoxin [Gammaproteobacteria bacterium]